MPFSMLDPAKFQSCGRDQVVRDFAPARRSDDGEKGQHPNVDFYSASTYYVSGGDRQQAGACPLPNLELV